MKILLLSCSTGEGHNHCALAVKEALDAAGHETSFLDMLHMFGDPGPLSFDKLLNRISSRTPEVFGMMYHAGAMYSATGVTSPVYLANIRHAKQLLAFIEENRFDAVIHFAQDLGYEVKEQQIPREAVYSADEAFFSGTAAEITPIASCDGLDIGPGHRGPITEKLQKHFFDYVEGKIEDKYHWLTPCKD